MSQVRELKTVTQVLDALGDGDRRAGRAELRRITGKHHSHVTNWLTIGRLPAWTWLVVSAALEARGHRMRPSVCGLKIPPPSQALAS